MSKPDRRVFNPVRISTDIGGVEYIIEPQPLARVLEFDDVLNELSSQFDDLADTFYVVDVDTGDDVAGPFEDRDDAQSFIDRAEQPEGKEIRTEGVPVRQVLDRLISSPYVILKPLIPELQEEHVRQMPFPQIKFVLSLLIEANGLEWFEAMVKNVLEPLLPKLTDVTAGALFRALQGVFSGSTETSKETPGETP